MAIMKGKLYVERKGWQQQQKCSRHKQLVWIKTCQSHSRHAATMQPVRSRHTQLNSAHSGVLVLHANVSKCQLE